MKRNPSSSSLSSSSSSSCIESFGSSPPKTKRRNRTKRILDLQTQPHLTNPPDTPSSATARRSSIYRGVTRHRWTGRFEAHLWDKATWNSIQNKKGRQIYLGAYDDEEAAARTYDLAALKYWGPTTILNFPVETYAKEIEDMEKMSKDEYLASLRRKSSGFSRGVSKYRGVARHHHNGRWEARIGRVIGSKYLYLGTYSTQEEAAAAYDMAAIEHRGPNAITNFDISIYADKLKNLQHKNPLSSSIEIQADETEHLQDRQQNTETVDSPQQVMDDEVLLSCKEPQQEQEQQQPNVMQPCDEHIWNLCLDSTTGPSLPISDIIPFDKPTELPDLFADSTFEDDIDFIFDYEAFEKDFNQEEDYASSGLLGSSTLLQVDSSRKDQQEPINSSTSVCTKF